MSKVKSNLRTAAVCVLIAFICLFGYVMLQNLSNEIVIQLGWEQRQALTLPNWHFVAILLVYAVLPPLIEEFIFRFLLCKGLKLTRLPDVWVIVIAAVIFMLYHRSWSQVVYQLLMGFFFAWIFLRTNQIGWTMLIHFINNTFVVTYTYIVGTGSDVFAINVGSVLLSLVTAVAATTAVTFLILKGIPHAQKS